jgi:hypothetical protein
MNSRNVLFFNVKYSRGGPHCKVLFKIREAQQLIEYQQRKKNKTVQEQKERRGVRGGPETTTPQPGKGESQQH